MPKSQSSETETLDEKIKRIRKKNEEIEKRRLEVEADKQTAAKLNALVQLSAPKEDWPPPRVHVPEDDRVPTTTKSRERIRGNPSYDISVSEGNMPPPDPSYKFLADAERDPLPAKNTSRYQQSSKGLGHASPRSRGRGNKVRDNLPPVERDSPGYEAWRAERNRIDEERIRRQRTAQGQWRREWDSQKSEEDWQAPNKEREKECYPAQSIIAHSYPQLDTMQKNVSVHNKASEEESKRDSKSGGRSVGRSTSDVKHDPLHRTITPFNKAFDEEKKQELNLGKNLGKSTSLFAGQPLKPALSSSDTRNVQSSGNTLHVSFVNEPSVLKAPSAVALRRPQAGSGRVGPPAAVLRRSGGVNVVGLPPRGGGTTSSRARATRATAGADAQPQRRARDSRPRRRAPPAPLVSSRKSSTGDDSWEDADDQSEGEVDAATYLSKNVKSADLIRSHGDDRQSLCNEGDLSVGDGVLPFFAGDEASLPTADESSFPAGDGASFPAGHESLAGDELTLPASDESLLPAGDEASFPAGDEASFPAGDQSLPADDEALLLAGNESSTLAGDESLLVNDDSSLVTGDDSLLQNSDNNSSLQSDFLSQTDNIIKPSPHSDGQSINDKLRKDGVLSFPADEGNANIHVSILQGALSALGDNCLALKDEANELEPKSCMAGAESCQKHVSEFTNHGQVEESITSSNIRPVSNPVQENPGTEYSPFDIVLPNLHNGVEDVGTLASSNNNSLKETIKSNDDKGGIECNANGELYNDISLVVDTPVLTVASETNSGSDHGKNQDKDPLRDDTVEKISLRDNISKLEKSEQDSAFQIT